MCARVFKCVLIMAIITLIVILLQQALVLYYVTTANKQLIVKPFTLDTEIYGRENEQNNLLEKILSNKHKVIEIIGMVGVGKTAFVLNTTDVLIKKHNHCRIYIELPRNGTVDVSSLIISKINQGVCMTTQERWISTLSSVASKFLNSKDLCRYWYEMLQPNAILILDSAENFLDKLEKEIIQPLSMLDSKSMIVLLVSRISKREYLKRPVIPLTGINSSRQCASWITSKYEQLRFDEGEQLCQELGGVPSDVIDAVELVMSPITTHSTSDFLSGLQSPEYGGGYRYLESILGRHYKDTRENNIAMYIHYHRLSSEHRECIWLLVEISKNGKFNKKMAELHLEQNVDCCIDYLLMTSFLQTVQTLPYKEFQFRRNVIKFIQSIGQPIPDVDDVRNKVWTFYGNYVKYNARNLYSYLHTTRDLQFAIDIGSDRDLVNSLLPLLGEKFNLNQLFKMALEIIEDYYCSSKGVYNSSNDKALFAFSYLTKAVYCPSIHPPAMLSSKPIVVPKPGMCLMKLRGCPAVLSMKINTYEAAEALGYHNSLVIYALKNVVPWEFSLIDVSMIVTVANRECTKFCKSDGYCHCEKQSNIEHGLRQVLLRNYALSTKYLQSTFYKLSDANRQCQTILKVIAIIGIDYAKRSAHDAVHLHDNSDHLINDIDFDNLEFSCFLGVLNDLIIPYLIDVKHNESQILHKKLNKIVSRVDRECNEKSNTDEDKLDCTARMRYTIAHGLTALKMTKLQEILRWPERVTEYYPREEWVCSIIRDKTTKCKSHLPTMSKVQSIETCDNYEPLWQMQYFLEPEKFAQLYEKARAIPALFQFMSI